MAKRSSGLSLFGIILFSHALLGSAAPAERAAARAFVNVPENNVTLVQHTNGLARFIGTDPGRPLPNPTLLRRAEDRAHAFLNSSRDLFVEPAAALELSTSRVVENDEVGISHVRLQQRINGIEIYGAEAVVHLTDLGVAAVSSNLISLPSDLNTVPSITSDVALATAQDVVLKTYGPVLAQFSTPTLQVFDRELMLGKSGGVVLTWYLEATGDALRERIWINAHTGEVTLNFSQIATARNRRTYDANNTTKIPLTPARTETQAAIGNFDVDTAHDFAGDFYNYFFIEHGRDSYNGLGITINSVVRVCDSISCPMKNAYWDGFEIALGAGYAIDDVVGHELSHAVIESSSGLMYQNEPGALNESYADIFGETIDLWNGKGNDAANVRWLIGEELPTAFGAGIRDMMNPAKFGDPARGKDPNIYCDRQDNGGVHLNSSVPNHAYALMVDGGIFNGYTITGIGLTKAAKIQYRALDTFLLKASGFIDNYNALLQSCTDLIGTSGITAGDCAQVKSALLAVEMNVIPCPTTTFNFPGARTTTEAGGTASYSVALTRQPTANVTLTMLSDNPAEGRVAPTSITFTPTNWNIARTLTLTGVDDAVMDGDIPYSITTTSSSSDMQFDQVIIPPVKATNLDNDFAGVMITPTSGLTTTESGGTAFYSVALASQPTADVTLSMLSDNVSEGSVAPASITFTPGSWNITRIVTLTGIDDKIMDGNVIYHVTTAISSADAKYGALTVLPVNVTNLDNDLAGITVTPISGLTTTESGGTASFTIHLDSQPTANVVIGLASSKASEGSVAPATLTFNADTWSTAQTVTVTGVDDAVADGDIAYTIITAPAVSADANYSSRDAADVSVTNSDNDQANILLGGATALVTSESGAPATFTLVLTTVPTDTVTIPIHSSNINEGVVDRAQIVFTSANWNRPQVVTVTGVDDAVLDGDIAYTIITDAAISTDAKYNGLNTADVQVLNRDNDSANIIVAAATNLETSESRGVATFTIVLSSQPSATVSAALASSNLNEGTVAPRAVIFTASNWNIPQTVAITGVDDAIADGDVAYQISIDPASSLDGNFRVLPVQTVSVINRDNEVPSAVQNGVADGLIITADNDLATTEGGGTATFTIKLARQPTAPVQISLRSSNSAEGVVTPATLTFGIENWNSPQTVTVTGVDDKAVDGNVGYHVQISAPSSDDATFASTPPHEVLVVNMDNDRKVKSGALGPLFLLGLVGLGIALRRRPRV